MGSAWIEVHVHVFEKMFTGSVLLSTCSFSLIHYFTAPLLFHSSALTNSLAQATQYCDSSNYVSLSKNDEQYWVMIFNNVGQSPIPMEYGQPLFVWLSRD